MASEQDLTYEQSRVDGAYQIAEEKAALLREKLADPATTQAGDNKAANRIVQDRRNQLDRLEFLLGPHGDFLLFGRVDLASNADLDGLAGGTFYVGLERLADVSDDPMVIAWESKVGKAFSDPAGFEDGHAVDRRRQFVGQKRQLIDLIDTYYENGRPKPGSGDPLLESLKGSTTGELHQVVASIQADQFRLMEFPADKTLVVQGGPGTGKTIVGLHRVSVLIYRSEGRLAEGDILVVGPTDVFVRYIDRVLPSLGRAAVQHRPMAALGSHGVSTRRRDDGLTREVKGRAVMAEVIARYLDQRIASDLDELVVSPGVVLRGDRLRRVLAPTTDRAPYMRRRERVWEALLREVDGGGSRQDEALRNALNRIMPDRSERQTVNDLLTGRKLLADASGGLLRPEEQTAILRANTNVNDAPWTIDDLPLLDEAAVLLNGNAAIGQRFRHIVVDEAQDLSPMQLRMLARRRSDDGALTILGDLAQNTSPWAPDDWETHLAAGGIEVAEFAELTSSYRIPAPLLDYANRLLQVIDVRTAATRSVIPEGEEPAVIAEDSPEDVYRRTADVVDSMIYMGAGAGQIGIIGLEDDLRGVSVALEDADVEHTWAARSLTTPVTLVPAEEAKGLEFNRVVVLEPQKLYRQHPVLGPRALYVAVTRARDELTLIHSAPLPPVLGTDSSLTEPSAAPAVEAAIASTPPPVPASADRMPMAAPGGAPGGWQWYVPVGRRLIEVVLRADGSALIVEVAQSGGPPAELGRGHAVVAPNGIAWALLTAAGDAIAVTTSPDPSSAAANVARAMTRDGDEE